MKTLIVTALMSTVLGLHGAPVLAQNSFTAEKVCGITRAPKGFTRIDVFIETAKFFKPLHETYQNKEQNTILVSNIKDYCWLKISTDQQMKSVLGTRPTFSRRAIYLNLASRSSAEEKFWEMVNQCGDDEENYLADLYYIRKFLQDFPINTNPEGTSLCFQALGYGSDSLKINLSTSKILVDIIVGTAFIGEIK
jgi:hypothetical protein